MSRKRFKFIFSRYGKNGKEEMFITKENLSEAIEEFDKLINKNKDKIDEIYCLTGGGKWDKVNNGNKKAIS